MFVPHWNIYVIFVDPYPSQFANLDEKHFYWVQHGISVKLYRILKCEQFSLLKNICTYFALSEQK